MNTDKSASSSVVTVLYWPTCHLKASHNGFNASPSHHYLTAQVLFQLPRAPTQTTCTYFLLPESSFVQEPPAGDWLLLIISMKMSSRLSRYQHTPSQSLTSFTIRRNTFHFVQGAACKLSVHLLNVYCLFSTLPSKMLWCRRQGPRLFSSSVPAYFLPYPHGNYSVNICSRGRKNIGGSTSHPSFVTPLSILSSHHLTLVTVVSWSLSPPSLPPAHPPTPPVAKAPARTQH